MLIVLQLMFAIVVPSLTVNLSCIVAGLGERCKVKSRIGFTLVPAVPGPHVVNLGLAVQALSDSRSKPTAREVIGWLHLESEDASNNTREWEA